MPTEAADTPICSPTQAAQASTVVESDGGEGRQLTALEVLE